MHFLNNICFLFAVFKVDKWIRKERAKYNRVMTSKSGQPNKEVPPAELATLQRWEFYKDHLLEGENMVSCDVSTCTNFCWCMSVVVSVCDSVYVVLVACASVILGARYCLYLHVL